MKAVAIRYVNERQCEIDVQRSYLFGLLKKVTTYRTDGVIVGDYYTWVELPAGTIVPDRLGLQLNVWLRNPDVIGDK